MSQQIETQVGLFRSFLEKIRQGSVDMMERLSVESLFQNQQENPDSVLRCEIFEISLQMQFQIIHKDHSHKYGIKTRTATETGNLQSGSMDQRKSHNTFSVQMDMSQMLQILLAKLG